MAVCPLAPKDEAKTNNAQRARRNDAGVEIEAMELLFVGSKISTSIPQRTCVAWVVVFLQRIAYHQWKNDAFNRALLWKKAWFG